MSSPLTCFLCAAESYSNPLAPEGHELDDHRAAAQWVSHTLCVPVFVSLCVPVCVCWPSLSLQVQTDQWWLQEAADDATGGAILGSTLQIQTPWVSEGWQKRLLSGQNVMMMVVMVTMMMGVTGLICFPQNAAGLQRGWGSSSEEEEEEEVSEDLTGQKCST